MDTSTKTMSQITQSAVEAAARMSRLSMDTAERVISLQVQYAKGTLEQATASAKAVSGAKDVQELLAVRTQSAGNAVEWLMNYSRSFYEVASEAQSEFSKLAEERMSSFQQAMTDGVDQATRSTPAGSDFASAAMKSSLAATTAAFDSFNKAARQVASFSDAGVRASSPARAKSRK
jgi:phasin family protein